MVHGCDYIVKSPDEKEGKHGWEKGVGKGGGGGEMRRLGTEQNRY